MKNVALLLLCACIGINAVGPGSWPSDLFGSWTSIPDYTVLGPLTETASLTWVIQPIEGGDLVISDQFLGSEITGSWQTFTTQGNNMLYCGDLYNFFRTSDQGATIEWPLEFQPSLSNDTHIVFCDAYRGCVMQWDFWVSSTRLETHLTIFQPVVHLHAVFTKSDSNVVTLAPSQLQCNFTNNNTVNTTSFSKDSQYQHPHSHKSGGACPFLKSLQKTPPPLKRSFRSGYQFCYTLNEYHQFQINWNFDPTNMILDVAISAKVNTGEWIAIGFQPDFPGMNGSDIVLGYISKRGDSCIRPMYAEHYIGVPIDSTDLNITNAAIFYNQGAATLKFSRPFNTGHNFIPVNQGPENPMPFTIMWGVGAAPVDCQSKPSYHFNARGLRAIDWGEPQLVMPDTMICQ